MLLLRFIASVLYLIDFGECVGRWDVFATKTLYEWAHDVKTPVFTNEHNHVGVESTLCKAIHVNMVVRHGARNPTLKNMKHIKELHEKIVTAKDPSAFPELDNWKYRYDVEREGELVSKGIVEQNDLGARTGARFNNLFHNNGKYVKFVSSRKSRAKDSAKHFHGGLSDYMTDKIPSFENEINNATMRFYDGCYNYEHQVEDNITQFEQFHKFSKTPQFINIAKSLKSKLKIPFSLSEDDVYQIYELCAYENYKFNDMTWCKLMSDDERIVLEYGQDIEKYYESSYGHPINSQMACPLVKDMFDTMEKAMNNSWDYENLGDMTNTEYLAGKFQFGHSETNGIVNLLKRFSVLKLSKMSTVKKEDKKFIMKLFVNEKEVTIPACDGWVCYYDKVKQQYEDYINKCNIKEICGSEPDEDGSQGNTSNNLMFHNLTGQLVALLFLLLFI